MKTRCLIVDDEPIAAEVLKNHVSKLENLEISKVCFNALQAFEYLQEYEVDLIFLDIQMPEITGLDFLKTLQNPPKVILVTAYREYALEGFELDVIDYLLKPVSFERFLKAVNKYYRIIKSHGKIISTTAPQISNDEFIWIRADRKNIKVAFNDILYVEGLKDYVKIYLNNNMLISKISIKELETKLPSNSFIRIHRSYIVSTVKIKAFTNEHVEIESSILPIGGSYKRFVLTFLNKIPQ